MNEFELLLNRKAYLVNCGIQIDQGFDVTPFSRHEVFGSIYATLDSTTSQELCLVDVFPFLKTYGYLQGYSKSFQLFIAKPLL